jgi:DNA-binding PadR family transcriptional regulator
MFHHHHHHHRRHGSPRGEQGGGRHAFPFSGRGRRQRVFDGSELRLVLLNLIAEKPRHGYDLIREIEARSGGAYAPSPGVVYPTLTLLLDMGLIEESSAAGPRKLFAITEPGQRHLADHAAEVELLMARLGALADVRERTDAAPVQRAMHNLKAALHDRLSQGGVDKTVILEVAALIDAAASKIERL